MVYKLIRPLIFSFDAESSHNVLFGLLKVGQRAPFVKEMIAAGFNYDHPSLEQEVLGMKFKNPVGLAAGFDKNCEALGILPAFGFGFVECGTITAHEQMGNPKPRLFRFEKQGAIVNRMGFNNEGSAKIAEKLKSFKKGDRPLGVNIGKSKKTELNEAAQDYLLSYQRLYAFGDYFTVNVSSPNTPNLRELQKNLDPILSLLQKMNHELAGGKALKPLFVKIAPDLAPQDLDLVLESCLKHNVDGIIATNTTLDHSSLNLAEPMQGGLSGRPLESKSTEFVRMLFKKAGKKIKIIGVGGVFGAQDAYRKIKAGASLVQIYSGWIYEGPALVKTINQGLARLLSQDGFKNISEAVGAEA